LKGLKVLLVLVALVVGGDVLFEISGRCAHPANCVVMSEQRWRGQTRPWAVAGSRTWNLMIGKMI